MCVGKCSRLVGPCLIVLSVFSVTLSLFMVFPNCDGSYWRAGHIGTDVIESFHAGVWLGGVLILLTGLQTTLSGYNVMYLPCCRPRLVMLLSFSICLLGVYGAFATMQCTTAVLNNGPYCLYKLSKEGDANWGYPMANSNDAYPMIDQHSEIRVIGIIFWLSTCLEPPNIVPWVASFSACIFLINFTEAVLCFSQLINASLGMCCGSCDPKKREMSVIERSSVSIPL